MTPNKIMIIEDDPIIQTELKNLLIGHGYEVSILSDFLNPVANIKKYNPHLIILDIKLPYINGFSI